MSEQAELFLYHLDLLKTRYSTEAGRAVLINLAQQCLPYGVVSDSFLSSIGRWMKNINPISFTNDLHSMMSEAAIDLSTAIAEAAGGSTLVQKVPEAALDLVFDDSLLPLVTPGAYLRAESSYTLPPDCSDLLGIGQDDEEWGAYGDLVIGPGDDEPDIVGGYFWCILVFNQKINMPPIPVPLCLFFRNKSIRYAIEIARQANPELDELTTASLLVNIYGWLKWLHSPYISFTEPETDRAERKRVASKGYSTSDIRVVTLRRRATPMNTLHEVEWNHRWAVRGHWRNQYLPSTKGHSLTWIAPYLKGPEDKPLVVSSAKKLFKVVR